MIDKTVFIISCITQKNELFSKREICTCQERELYESSMQLVFTLPMGELKSSSENILWLWPFLQNIALHGYVCHFPSFAIPQLSPTGMKSPRFLQMTLNFELK